MKFYVPCMCHTHRWAEQAQWPVSRPRRLCKKTHHAGCQMPEGKIYILLKINKN